MNYLFKACLWVALSAGLLACGDSEPGSDPGDNAGAEGGRPGDTPGKGDIVDGNRGGASGAAGKGQEQAGGVGGSEETGGAGGAGEAGGTGGASGTGGGGGEGLKLRIMAANTTSGNGQSYDAGHGQRIFQGLKPDIVLIQEFRYKTNTPANLREFVDDTFGPEFAYYRGAGNIPNGVISRYPIVESGEWNDTVVGDREFTWAKIDLPGPKDLWTISVHLYTKSARAAQAQAIIREMTKKIPRNDLVVLGGDFNTKSRREACVQTLKARFNMDGPYPMDRPGGGNYNTNQSRKEPYDWVVASPELHNMEVPLVIGANSFANGIVFDSRVYTPLSDVAPVQRGDSSAKAMQHMAVARDFVVK